MEMTIPTVGETEDAERERLPATSVWCCDLCDGEFQSPEPPKFAHTAGPSFLGFTESRTELLSVRWSLMQASMPTQQQLLRSKGKWRQSKRCVRAMAVA